MTQPLHHTSHRRRAQSLVEFALVAPLLVALIVGAIELGILFVTYIGLTNSAREGARAAAVYRYNGPAPLSTETNAYTKIDTSRQTYASSVITATLSPLSPTTALTMTMSYTPTIPLSENPYRAGDTVAVTLQQRHQVLFGLLGKIDIMLRSVSAVRIEPGGAE